MREYKLIDGIMYIDIIARRATNLYYSLNYATSYAAPHTRRLAYTVPASLKVRTRFWGLREEGMETPINLFSRSI